MLAEDLAKLVTDSVAVVGDIEAVMSDLHLKGDAAEPESLLRALPIMGRLRITATDKTELVAFAAASAGKTGAINWCALAKNIQTIIAALTAAGVPIPPYITLIATLVAALCPNP
jgi:hypothetical protein